MTRRTYPRPGRSVRYFVVVDLLANTIGVLVLVLGLATIGGITGFRLLEGWALVGAIALLALVTVVTIAAVVGRRIRMRARLAKDKAVDAALD